MNDDNNTMPRPVTVELRSPRPTLMGTQYYKTYRSGFGGGVWTDAEGTKITQSYLSETVYFYIDTQLINYGDEMEFQLWEYDTLTLDEKTFMGEEVKLKAKVKEHRGGNLMLGRVNVELELPESWTEEVKNNHGRLRLYWKVKHPRLGVKKLPASKDDYLGVGYSNHTLRVKASAWDSNFPELYTHEGELVLAGLIDQATMDLINTGVSNVLEHVEGVLAEYMILCKFEKGCKLDAYGNVVDNLGNIVTDWGVNGIHPSHEFKIGYGRTQKTIKLSPGVSKAVYKTGNVTVKALGALNLAGGVLDLRDIMLFGMEENHNEPLPFVDPYGLSIALNLIARDQYAKWKEWDDEHARMAIENAKKKGASAVNNLMSERYVAEAGYAVTWVPYEVAMKVINGEFKNMGQVHKYPSQEMPDCLILYKRYQDQYKNDIDMIESIFVDNL